MTKEEFIKKAREIHGWKYDYSMVQFKSNKDKVAIICPEHGVFYKTIEKHLYDELSRVHFNSGSATDLLIEIKI